MFPLFTQAMTEAGVADGDLRFVIHTHSHSTISGAMCK